MEIILFDEKKTPCIVTADLITEFAIWINGVEYKCENDISTVHFSDVFFIMMIKQNGKIWLTPFFRERTYSESYEDVEFIRSSIESISDKIDLINKKLDDANKLLKSAKAGDLDVSDIIQKSLELVDSADEYLTHRVMRVSLSLTKKGFSVPIILRVGNQRIEIQAIVDTASEISLIDESSFLKCFSNTLPDKKVKIEGVSGKSEYIPSTSSEIVIKGKKFREPLGIIQNLRSRIGYDVLLSIDIFNQLVDSKFIEIKI